MQSFNQKMLRFFQTLWPAEEKPIVLGEGRTKHPPVMLIGEAPGEQESLQGRPFVGKAGKNLDGFLRVLELSREDIYITNAVKIRPTKTSEKGRISNRPPNREELALFTPYLMEEILLVQPRMIVTLGNVALKALCGSKAIIGAMHGACVPVSVSHEKHTADFPLFPLYHPASIIYNRSLQAVYDTDLIALRTLLSASADI